MISDEPQDELDGERPDSGSLIVFAVVFEGCLAPVALIVGWLLGQKPLADFAWSLRAVGAGLLATLPMLALLGLAVRWPLGPFRRIVRFFDREVRPLLRLRPWTDLALISLAAGVGEEMLFRGVIQGALCRALGTGTGLLLASLVFGAFHPITPGYAVIAGFLGLYLGGVWLVTGNLLAVMIAHAVYDFVALLILLRWMRTLDD